MSCKDVLDFLGQVRGRSVTATLADPVARRLAELELVEFYTADQYRDLTNEIASMGPSQAALAQESADRAELASELREEVARDHSILFHLHGKATRADDLSTEERTRTQFQAVDADLTEKEQAFNALMAKRAVFDGLTAYGDRYVGLTVAGAIALRDLTVRLYRYADVDFEAYFAQAQKVDQGLEALATGAAAYFTGLSNGIPGADRAYLWAIGIGLASSVPDPATGVPRFLEAYRSVDGIAGNPENRLMASEILLATPTPLAEAVPALAQLVRDVRAIGIAKESALGVASVILFGRRADGTFATPVVQQYLRLTRSYETAALLGITNVPVDALTAKFDAVRQMFGAWGYTYSEDTELASAYLAVSENAPDQLGTKLAILARGLSAYLQYPLVAAAILGSIATLEANEALNLVEKAYGTIGRRAVGLGQTELICLAVRMVHGIRNELIGGLDATAVATPAPAVAYGVGPRAFFLPVVIVHGGYYATYGGISGVHPGHVHAMPTGFGGAGVG